jgi:pimeloyl-ACP methyl ester carboxylesterase
MNMGCFRIAAVIKCPIIQMNVMMAGAKLPAPRTANELLGADFGSAKQHTNMENAEQGVEEIWFDGPFLIAQGVLDPLNDARDRMARYAALRPGIATDAIAAGHCPHDECPDLVAHSIVQWWSATRTAATTAASTAAATSSTRMR